MTFFSLVRLQRIWLWAWPIASFC